MRTLLHNACIISPGFQLDNAAVLLHGERIERLFTAKQKLPEAEQKIDLEGQWLLPGFIDIHCHGRDNHDFCDASDAAFEQIGKGKLKEGVSGFLATTLTLPKQELRNTFMCARRYQKNNRDGARLLGMHLEGPFFHPDGAGAQNPKYLRPPDFSLVAELHALCPIRIASFSPELPGALPFITQLCQAGIMPSGAHSGADYACTLKAMRAGMRHLTHFCNVMSPLHHLRFGMVGAGLSEKQLMLEIICDGVHLSDPMIKFIFQVKGADSLMLISDAIRAAAMPDGEYSLGGLPVLVKNGKAVLAHMDRVAGSTLQFHQALQRAARISRLPPCELVKCSSWNQARSLGLQGYGKIEPGYAADFTVSDQDWNPQQTWVAGQPRWKKA